MANDKKVDNEVENKVDEQDVLEDDDFEEFEDESMYY